MPTQTTQKNSGEKTRKVEWKRVKLGEVLEFHRGYDLPISKIIEGKFPVVFSNGEKKYHYEYKIKAPGITIGRSGTLGKPFFVNEDFWPHNTTLFVSNFFGNDPKYLYYFLKTLDLGNYNAGAGVPTLNRNHIHTIQVEIPPLSEQKKIAEVLSAYDDLIEVNQKKIKILETLAQTLYKEWFVKPTKDGWAD